MKQKSFDTREQELIYRIEYEHICFKNKEILKNKVEIYDDCNKVRFVECVYEYLIYNENIPTKQVESLLKCQEGIFDTLYRIYLKNEHTEVGRWEDVSNLIDLLIK